jgi:DNA-binding transcriptional ArsR family regulator/fido (protein-threonine AMPylation protein)
MARRNLPEDILGHLQKLQASGATSAGAHAIAEHLGVPWSTLMRHLAKLMREGRIERQGAGPATRYRLRGPVAHQVAVAERLAPVDSMSATVWPQWSERAAALRAQLQAPLGTRAPVSYRRAFVDDYQPNASTLLAAQLAAQLYAEGRSPGQQPAGTYARKVLEQLLIDLSWSSSRLEGNRKSLLDTQALFARGRSEGDDADATMLLNHKEAIEFMVDTVPAEGITVPVVRNLQSLLMQGLLEEPQALGAIRRKVVNISDTTYVPSQVPSLLEEMLAKIVDKARNVRNPVEAAFFLWVNLAYLQPFEDGNKRTSRLSGNLPLMLANCAPLSFLDVEPTDYALAMLGVYEKLDVTLAVELFAWTYRRSIAKYHAVLQSVGAPDPLRTRYRELIGEAVRQVVYYGVPLAQAVKAFNLPEGEQDPFTAMAREELRSLQPYNCARYRLPIAKTTEWIEQGRPRL